MLSSGILLSYNKQWQLFTCVCCLCSFASGEIFWARSCLQECWLSVDFYQISWRNFYFLPSSIRTLAAERCLINYCNHINRISVAHLVCSAHIITLLSFKIVKQKRKRQFTCRRHQNVECWRDSSPQIQKHTPYL